MAKVHRRLVGKISEIVPPRSLKFESSGKLFDGGTFRRTSKNEILGFEIEGNLWKEKHN